MMADTFTSEQRSGIMRAVKSSGNKTTEVKLIALFRQHRISGWRRRSKIFGSPDFVLKATKTAVFADGCFWHGHTCRGLQPVSNQSYWRAKIDRNRKRDKYVSRILKARGWRVIRLWECEIKNGDAKVLRKLASLKTG